MMQYLAFDFGDGTTAVAEYNESFDEMTEPKVLNIIRGKNEIWSFIGISRTLDNEIVVGEGIDPHGYKIYSNWKTYPSSYNKTDIGRFHREISVKFMKRCFEMFIHQNPEYNRNGYYKNNEKYKTVIGVPCDWNNDDIREYLNIAKEAGLPNVEVLKESQAAMFFARRWMTHEVNDDDIKKGVLLIDMGSSTTDFTYIKGADIVKHAGLPLGAKYIERLIVKNALERGNATYYYRGDQNDGKRIVSDDLELASDIFEADLMHARLYKEEFFSKVDQSPLLFTDDNIPARDKKICALKNTVIRTMYLPYSGLEEIGDNHRITWDFFDRLLSGRDESSLFTLNDQTSENWKEVFSKNKDSWRGHFIKALEYIKNKWELKDDVAIVLTGGASRMHFIEFDIESCFSGCKLVCGKDNNRTFSVVKGLAWAAYAKDEIKKRKEKIINISKDYTSDEDIRSFIDKSVEQIFDKAAKDIQKKVGSKIGGYLSKKNDCVNTLRKVRNELDESLKEEANAFYNRLNTEMDFNNLLSQPPISSLSSDLYEKFSRPSILIDKKVDRSFTWSLGTVISGFNFFKGAFWNVPANDDESFDGVWGWGLMWDNAKKAFNNNFTVTYVRDFLTDSGLWSVAWGSGVEPEERQSAHILFKKSLAKSLLNFKIKELDALLGAFEYNLDQNLRDTY